MYRATADGALGRLLVRGASGLLASQMMDPARRENDVMRHFLPA